MSTSLLYHAFGVRGYRYRRTEYREGQVIFRIEQERESLRCAQCGSSNVGPRGHRLRRFRTVPIGRKAVFVELPVPRVACEQCGGICQVKVPFADPLRRHTRAFERYALELSRRTTVQDAATHLGVSWTTVAGIQQRHLKRRFGRPKLKGLRLIAIDEISIRKGHRYLTVVLDLATGAIVFVAEGRSGAGLRPFLRRLKRSGAQVAAVAMDMWQPYIAVIQEHLPAAQIVFDRFHVTKLFNGKLSDLRREVQREATDLLHKRVLKGTRWLLLKSPENLDEARGERERLEEALRLNKPLATAYYLKEDLRQFWEQPDKATAQTFLADWMRRAQASGVRILQDFAKTLAAHRTGLLGYYDHPISTGPLEGTNTKIRVLQRQAYGFRNMAFFKLKLLGLHETKVALVG
jgi:transposase